MTHRDEVFTITALTPQEKRPWRTSIFINGEFWRGFDTEVVVELGLHEGQRLLESELEALDHTLEKRKAMNRALLLLSYRGRSVHEIEGGLKKAGFFPETIQEVTSDLRRLGYLDDVAFAQSWAKSRMDSKRYGPLRVKQELRLKGLPDNVIAGVLDEAASPTDEFDRAKALAESKIASYTGLERGAAFRRLSQFLLRRGYSPSVVYDVCKAIL